MTLKTVPKLKFNIPGYTITDVIGEGGMAVVYLAEQESLKRKVAIKLLRTLVTEDRDLADRFVDEAKTIARLDHPNIISIIEAKQLNSGLAFFSMPYLDRGDLSDYTFSDDAELVNIMVQICQGLSCAHTHGVIHRDLKPENILFDQFDKIKIADFGIALSTSKSRRTKEHSIIGTTHYMSPEQAQSQPVDGRSDIYSLGAILYQILTGKPVFPNKDDLAVILSHISEPVPRLPREVKHWQAIVDKCLAKSPRDRYQNCQELETALRALPVRKRSSKPAPKRTNKNQAAKRQITARRKAVQNTSPKWIKSLPYVGFIAILGAGFIAISNYKPDGVVSDPATDTPPSMTQPLDIPPPLFTAEDNELDNMPEVNPQPPPTEDIGFSEADALSLILEGNDLLRRMRLTRPPGDNAAQKYMTVLSHFPNNTQARLGMQEIGERYFSLMEESLAAKDFDSARQHAQTLKEFWQNPGTDASQFEPRVSRILSRANELVQVSVQQHKVQAETQDMLALADVFLDDRGLTERLREQLRSIPLSGDVYRDQNGFDSVYLAGDLIKNNSPYTGPYFTVTTTEVSRQWYQAFAAENPAPEHKCMHQGKMPFFKKTWVKPPFDVSDDQPITCISGDDAQRFAAWVSQRSGHKYRLPTLNEWRYLTRLTAASSAPCATANIAGRESDRDKSVGGQYGCTDAFEFLSPVGDLQAESYKLHDVHGNASEWVIDGTKLVAVGHSWYTGPAVDNAAVRSDVSADGAYSDVGFRLVRDIHGESR